MQQGFLICYLNTAELHGAEAITRTGMTR